MSTNAFSAKVLDIDCAKEVAKIAAVMQENLIRFKRRGYIVALSGGIDSSVTCALAVHAVGKDRVFGLHMPERDSGSETLSLSQSISNHFGIDSKAEILTPMLDAVGCYSRLDDSVRKAIPEYGAGWKMKIVLPNFLETKGINFYSIIAQTPSGETIKKRLPLDAYLGIVAATNFKQRIRKMMEYYHADRLNFAVTGTPNRLEYDQGFFVKLGDGAADLKPIAHLYKTQVYQLAEFLGVPEKIRRRPPTTDTYSLPQGQDEFYFSLPYDKMDLCLYAKNHGIAPEVVAQTLGVPVDPIKLVFKDIDTKRATTRYLHLGPQLIEAIPEILH